MGVFHAGDQKNKNSRTFPLPEQTVFLPSFDAEESMGARKNDRFAYGSVTAMRVSDKVVMTMVMAYCFGHL